MEIITKSGTVDPASFQGTYKSRCAKCYSTYRRLDPKSLARIKLSHKKFYQNNKEKLKEYGRIYSKMYKQKIKTIHPEKIILKRARERARSNSLEFNLTQADIIIPEYCPVLGIKLQFNKIEAKDDSISIDRIDSSKGYIKGNVIIVSRRVNTIKNNATPEELYKIADFYKNLQKVAYTLPYRP